MKRRLPSPGHRDRFPAAARRASRAARVSVAAVLLVSVLAVFAAIRRGGVPFMSATSATHPNVLLITIDTLRWDHVGCYGAKGATTPALDRLAAEGVRFETAIMHVPLTAPSHASILTGLTPLHHGVRDNGAFGLPAGIPTLATTLKGAGYATAGFISGFPLDRRFGFAAGFDTYDDRLPRLSRQDLPGAAGSERRADATTARALAWLEAHAPAGSSEGTAPPWFLWVHYFDPHAAYDPPAEWRERYPGHPYDGEIAFVDQQVGRLLKGIPRPSAGAGTLVLVTADHGESLGEHGESTHGVFVYDATLRVPWIVAGPGVPASRISTSVARGVDVMPTLLDLARVPAPPNLDGRSLTRALAGREMPDEPAYVESLLSARHFGWAELHGLRTARWKYISAPSTELYDLAGDSGETKNLAASHSGQAVAMARQLDAGMRTAPFSTAARPRDPEAERRLGALGYLARTPRASGEARRDPKSAISLIDRLEHAIADTRRDPGRATAELRRILAEDPGISIARSQLASGLSRLGDHRGAIEQIEALRTAGGADPDDLLVLAESLRSLGRLDEAKKVRDEAARLDPASPEPALTEARADMAASKLVEAADAYRRALELAPEQPEALTGLGEISLRNGEVPAAGGYFERALAQDPGDTFARTRLGMIRGRQGRFEEAVRLLREAVQDAPGDGEALAGLAAALARSGAPADAVPYFERAVAAGARTPAVLNGLGFARLETGDRAGALAALRASLAIEPGQPGIARAVQDLTPAAPAGGLRP